MAPQGTLPAPIDRILSGAGRGIRDDYAAAGGSSYGPTPQVARTGVATYQDADGTIQLANDNEIRIDHSLGYPGFLIEPAATQLVENENDLVYHVTCARNRPDGEPEPGLDLNDAKWFCSRDDAQRLAEIPQAYRTLLESLQQFVRDKHEHESVVEEYTGSLLGNLPGLTVPAAARLTDRLFQVADSLAIHYQKRVNLSSCVTFKTN